MNIDALKQSIDQRHNPVAQPRGIRPAEEDDDTADVFAKLKPVLPRHQKMSGDSAARPMRHGKIRGFAG